MTHDTSVVMLDRHELFNSNLIKYWIVSTMSQTKGFFKSPDTTARTPTVTSSQIPLLFNLR